MHYALGALNIAGWFPCIAGSNIKANRKIFQRTANVNTAAFPTIDTHIQWYFVPYRQLMSVWDDFKLNIQDINSSAIGSAIPANAPYFNLYTDVRTILTHPTSGIKDGAGQSFVYGALRLLNQCGYGNYTAASEIFDQVDVNVLPLLAYQKIYYDHFRNTAYESNDNEAYNVDKYYTSSYSYDGHVDEQSVIEKLLKLHYVNYRNDYFNNIYPALNYVQSSPAGTDWTFPVSVVGAHTVTGLNITDPSDPSLTTYDSNRWKRFGNSITGSTYPADSVIGYNTSAGGYLAQFLDNAGTFRGIRHDHELPVLGLTSGQISSVFNVQQIRAMFALDKLMRSSAYAPKHAKEQYEARFGIKFRNNPNESLYLGSMKNDVVIGEVTSMANTQATSGGVTTGDSLGAIGGKGIGSSDWEKDSISFNCEEDGICMAIMYSTVRSMYDSNRVDSYLLKSAREDFFQPEFMDLGLQPITAREYGYGIFATQPNAILLNAILGYVPRYQEYKLSVDENLGLFAKSNQSLSAFVNHTNNKFVVGAGWQGGLPFTFFKVKPTDLDGVTEKNYDDSDGIYQSDQFFTWLQLGFVVNQNMSVHGQPRL